MHPSGIQFGLSRGLLQLRGEEVLLSDQLVEAISAQAQLHLQKGRHPIQGNLLVEITVRAAQDAAAHQLPGTRQEMTPFYAGLNRTMYYTLFKVCHEIVKTLHASPIPITSGMQILSLCLCSTYGFTAHDPVLSSDSPVDYGKAAAVGLSKDSIGPIRLRCLDKLRPILESRNVSAF